MKALLWKELRENAKWAALGWLVLTMAEFYSFGKIQEQAPPLVSSTFLLISPFGCILVGAALGVLQILPELGRDRWAALLHRPVTRGAIFAGKAIAGLILYGLATGLPLLASVWYTASPGRFAAPFTPQMLEPAVSDIFLGSAAYFMALLLCLHQGRWWGSRGAVLLAMVPLIVMHLASARPFLWPILTTAILALAGWGAMRRKQDWLTYVALLLVVLMGAAAALLIGGTVLLNVFPSKYFENYTYQSFVVTEDGQVLVQRSGNGKVTLTDMAGQVVTDERYSGGESYEHLIRMMPFAFVTGPDFVMDYYNRQYMRNEMHFARSIRTSYDSKEIWYQLVQQNYLIGYDRLSRRCVGTVDDRGFHPPETQPHAFPEPLRTYSYGGTSPFCYWAGEKVYMVDFAERKFQMVYDAGDVRIFSVTKVTGRWDKPGYLAAALTTGMKFFDEQGNPVLDLPYAHDPTEWPSLQIGASPDLSHLYIEYAWTSYFLKAAVIEPKPTYLQVVATHDGASQSYSVPSNPIVLAPVRTVDRMVTALLPTSPVLLMTLVVKNAYSQMYYPGMISQPTLAVDRRTLWDLGAMTVACALAAALLAWRGRLGRRQMILWAGFVLLFGAPGLLAFLIAANWPVRVKCAKCDAMRPVREETCPHCAGEWPKAESTGTEILEGVR